MGLGLNLGLSLGMGAGSRRSPDMILVYEIPAPNTDIELAIQANSTWFGSEQSVSINWGDGSADDTVSDTGGDTYIGHTYAAAGTYKVKISGSMKQYARGGNVSISGQTLLTRIESFGQLGIKSFVYAFYNCTGLMAVPKTLPDSVTSMFCMFHSCSGAAFNPDVSKWDVSKVTTMSYMFRYCSGAAFNPDMKSWTLKTGAITTSMIANSKTQLTTWLDDLLIAWAANPAQGNNITIDFSPNSFTEDGGEPLPAVATALATLEGKGWIITTANPYSST